MEAITSSHLHNSLACKSIVNISSILLISFITIYAYLPSIDNEFLYWDDQFYVTSNYSISHPTRESLNGIATQVVSLNYHPVTMLSLWINAKISGVKSARPFILTNILLHVLNAALVFFLAYSISNSNWIISFTTSLIFALHPMHVESVVWVSERKDLLYGFFFLGSLLSYWKYTHSTRSRYYLLSFVSFILSCLSKATAVSLAPCLFLIEFYSKRNFSLRTTYVYKIPFLFTALVIGFIAVDIQGGGDFCGLLHKDELSIAYNQHLSLGMRILNSCSAHFYYLTNFIYPSGHSAFHPYTLISKYNFFLVLLVSISTIITIAWAVKSQKRQIVFGLSFYCFTIFLLLQFIPVGSAIVAERYSYLAYIGLAFLIGIALDNFWNSLIKSLPIICLSIITIICVRNTRLQANKWQNHTTLFEQAVLEYPEDSFIRKTLASGYWAEGHINKALYHITFAIDELELETSKAIELLANCHADKGNYKEANSFFDQAVALDSNNISARYHRGLNLLSTDPKKALEDFNYCEQSNNQYFIPLIYGPRGRAYALMGQYENAIRELSQAIKILPEDSSSYLDRAVTYEKTGKTKKAISDYMQVLRLDPNNQYASERLAIISY